MYRHHPSPRGKIIAWLVLVTLQSRFTASAQNTHQDACALDAEHNIQGNAWPSRYHSQTTASSPGFCSIQAEMRLKCDELIEVLLFEIKKDA